MKKYFVLFMLIILEIFLISACGDDKENLQNYTEKTHAQDNQKNYINDKLIREENIGRLNFKMPADEAVKILGEAENKTEPAIWGADGLSHETWDYKTKGIKLDIIEENAEKTVNMITITAPCDFKTNRNIGVGSSRKEVIEAYKDDIDNEKSSDDVIVCGSVYGGLVFRISNEKVVSVFLGASAE